MQIDKFHIEARAVLTLDGLFEPWAFVTWEDEDESHAWTIRFNVKTLGSEEAKSFALSVAAKRIALRATGDHKGLTL